jgi:holin-like protein
MLLLFALLAWRPQVANAIEPTALELLRHLSLLFVPAGVGVMVSATELRGNTLAVIVAVAVSTALAIAMTAVVTRALLLQTENAARGLARVTRDRTSRCARADR